MLVESLLVEYPLNDDALKAYLISNTIHIVTANDFFQSYADYISNGKPIDVRSSTSWGICQQMLGKLDDASLAYIKYRQGTWTILPESCDFNEEFAKDYSQRHITFRKVAKWLAKKFPH
jgi:hypothetical protein